LIRNAPYPNGARLIQVEQVISGRTQSDISMADIRALREGDSSLSQVTYAWFSQVSLLGNGLPDRARRVFTDSHAFSMLGVNPILGRLPTEQDDEPGASAVAVLGYEMWVNRFGARPEVIGQTLRIDGEPHTIIAVMPAVFTFPAPYWTRGDLWVV